MVELLILWGYMLAVNGCIGMAVLQGLLRLAGRKDVRTSGPFGLAALQLAGVAAITVYAETVSLFAPVSMAAHLVLLAAALGSAWLFRGRLFPLAKRLVRLCFSWEGALYLCFVLMTAYFASRGLQHTDTGIYHAQAIRWYEEYGLVKGQANLQQHFGYNSAYLAYAAAFSMKWLLGQSLHGTTGFLQAFLTVWALHGLKGVFRRRNHAADGCRIAILLYAVVIAERAMSPATDFGAMYLVLWILTLWAQLAWEGAPDGKENQDGKENPAESGRTDAWCLLCVAVVCVTTYKLSAGMLAVLALYPAARLLKARDWRRIGVYLGAGLLVLAPWLARNVLVSGWLLYPFPQLDLFSVDWKVPARAAQYDSDQIKVWGRCLYDVGKIDWSMDRWLPVWWGEKDRYEKMLLLANGIALASACLGGAYVLWRRKRLHGDRLMLYAGLLAGLAGWFFTAPFLRYGLAFLLVFPLLVLGEWLRPLPLGPVRIASGFACAAVFFSLSMYLDYYILFDLVWIKQHLTDPAWLVQQDYDRVETGELELEGGLTVYYPLEGDNISYHAFPGTAYKSMAEQAKMRGSTIADGFLHK
ncbi:MAG: hypothetical protein Q4C65_11640 [Eubacteriales bacterium]|nr:hypothetical protein [Eubacteriales bacterium]